MDSRKWGLVAIGALILAAGIFGASLLWPREREADALPASAAVTGTPAVSPSPLPAATPTPPPPVTYTVQAGDTLSAIAQQHDVSMEALVAANDLPDPDVLQIGQVLMIPEDDATAAPPSSSSSPTPSEGASGTGEETQPPTLTPSGPPLVEIREVEGVGDLETEALLLRNEGGTESLEGWRLAGTSETGFDFPALTLFPGGEVWVVSRAGEDTPRRLYWNRTESAWSRGELITLRDSDGNIVDTFIVPE